MEDRHQNARGPKDDESIAVYMDVDRGDQGSSWPARPFPSTVILQNGGGSWVLTVASGNAAARLRSRNRGNFEPSQKSPPVRACARPATTRSQIVAVALNQVERKASRTPRGSFPAALHDGDWVRPFMIDAAPAHFECW